MPNFKKIIKKKTEKRLINEFLPLFRNSIEKKAKTKKRFSLVLCGGKSPINLYQHLVRFKINWNIVDFFLVDERLVNLGSKNSNYKLINDIFLKQINIKKKNIYNINTSKKNIYISTNDYEKKIRKYFKNKKVIFDLVILGMGNDGHIASIFPNKINFKTDKIVGNTSRNDFERITLNLNTINKSKNIYLWLNNKKKSNIFKKLKKEKLIPVNYLNRKKTTVFSL